MTNLSLYFGVIGNIISGLLFLSQAHTFYRIVRNKSTEEFESLPYICTLLNSALWTYYGIINPTSILVAPVNGFGVVVETIYLMLFLIYASPEVKVKTIRRIVWVDVVSLGAVVSVAEILSDKEIRIHLIGYMAAELTIIMYIVTYVSPPAALQTAVMSLRTPGVEYMPFLFPLFCFFSGGIWVFYAILVKDFYVWVPNAIGFSFATVQLVLYYNRRNSNETINFVEDGSQKESLLD